MAVSFGAAGTSASGTTSCAPSYPTGISAATSRIYCFVTGRSNTAGTAPTMPAGWSSIADFEGGTGTWGVDTGTRRVTIFRKNSVDGSESGTVTVSLSGTTANTMRATIVRFEVTSGHGVLEEVATGADTSDGTSFSATGSSNIDFAANDLLAVLVAQNIDSGTQSAQSITASGITFGTRTNRASTAVTNGNDHRHILDTVPVSSGSGTVAPTYAYTISASGSGPVAFLRLRESPLGVTVLTKGTNGSSASSATTASVTTTDNVAQLLAVAVTPDNAGSDTDFTISGWTKVHQVNFNPGDLERSVSLWSKAGTGGSESATITAPAGETYLEFRWIWMEWAGLGSLTQATSATGSSSSPSVTLGSFGAGSGTLEIIGSASGLNPTVGSGFAHIDEQSGSVQGDFITVGWRPDADTSVDASSSSGSDYWGIIGVELVPGTWAGTEGRTVSPAGVGAASWQAGATNPKALTSSGVAAASWDSAALSPRTLSVDGVASLSWYGGAAVGRSLTSAGAASASFAGAGVAIGALGASGASAASWQAAAVAGAGLAAFGVAAATWQSASVSAAAMSAAGQGALAWQWSVVAPRTFSISGVAAAAFSTDSATIEARTLSCDGVASADFEAAAIQARTLDASGGAAAQWLSQSGSSGQPVHEIDIGGSPLWWQNRHKEKPKQQSRKQPQRRDSASATEQARQVIEHAAKRHAAAGDLTKDARYADVRLALKPLRSEVVDWAAMYEALYSMALNDAIARELAIEAQLQDEDELILLMA